MREQSTYHKANDLLDRFQSDLVLTQPKEPSQFWLYQILFSLGSLLLRTEIGLSLKRKRELLWCDGSKLDSRGTGAAVVWKNEGTEKEWQEQKVGLGLNKEIFDAEMWGISEAVKVAEQKVRQVRELWVISIFCDSQTIINNLRE